jgi:hypothetical protein
MSSSGIAVGLKKGYPVEKREKVARPVDSKGVSDVRIFRIVPHVFFCLENLQKN